MAKMTIEIDDNNDISVNVDGKFDQIAILGVLRLIEHRILTTGDVDVSSAGQNSDS